jgi:TPR repeat protein
MMRKPEPQCVQWLRAAAEAGDAVSMLNLGTALFHEVGVRADYVEAYVWFTLAAERGMIDGRIGLRPKMTAAQIAEAEKRAADWDARLTQ